MDLFRIISSFLFRKGRKEGGEEKVNSKQISAYCPKCGEDRELIHLGRYSDYYQCPKCKINLHGNYVFNHERRK